METGVVSVAERSSRIQLAENGGGVSGSLQPVAILASGLGGQ